MKEVSLRSCDNYEYKEVKKSIEKLLNDLGGIKNI